MGTGRGWGRVEEDVRGLWCLSPGVMEQTLVQSLSRLVTPWTAARQASLSITNSQTLLKLMSIESVMPSNHLILSRPPLPPSIFPSIRVFSSESALPIRWPKYWSFSFSISPSNEYSELIYFRLTTLISLQELTGLASNLWFGPVISFL